eukprot:403337214
MLQYLSSNNTSDFDQLFRQNSFDLNIQEFNFGFFEPKKTFIYDDSKSQAKQNQNLHLHKHVSRNNLLEILPYLKCHEISKLILTNKELKNKITCDPYFNVVMIQSYQDFYMQQFFNQSNKFDIKLFSYRSASTAINSEENLNIHHSPKMNGLFQQKRNSSRPTLNSLSCESNSFSDQLMTESQTEQESRLWDLKSQDQIQSENTMMASLLNCNYKNLVSNKSEFLKKRADELQAKFFVTPATFVREMFLDPIDCESKSYLLPSLTRTSFKLDKGFNKIDKILTEKYRSSIFLSMTKSQIQDLLHVTTNQVESTQHMITNASQRLLSVNCNDLTLEQSVAYYTLTQFKVLADSHMMKAQQSLNEAIQANKPFDFLTTIVEHDSHIKELMKKVLNNQVISESFKQFLQDASIIPGNEEADQFLSDKYLAHLLKHIWSEYFINLYVVDMSNALFFEIKQGLNNINEVDLFSKNSTLTKALKMLRNNKANKQFEIELKSIFVSSIENMLQQIHQSVESFSDFSKSTKFFDQLNFLGCSILNQAYQKLKLKFVAISFAKDLQMKVEDSKAQSKGSDCIQLSLHQIVNESMHSTVFFKTLKQISAKSGSAFYESANIRQALIMAGQDGIRLGQKLNKKIRQIFDSTDNINLTDIAETKESFENEVVSALLEVLKSHDIKKEIETIKELERLQTFNRINMRVSQLKEEVEMNMLNKKSLRNSVHNQSALNYFNYQDQLLRETMSAESFPQAILV